VDCCSNYSDVYIFADDAKFSRHIVQPYDINLLQHALDSLQKWTQKWLLSLNIKKCKVVSYGRNVDKTYTYKLVDYSNQENALERVEKIKDLGVWFDEKLTFKEHINDINVAYMMLGLIKRNYGRAGSVSVF